MDSKVPLCPSTDSKRHPHLALVPLALDSFSIYCLLSKWSGPVRLLLEEFLCVLTNGSCTGHPEITGHTEEINVPLQEIEALLI